MAQQRPLSSLNADCLTVLATYLDGADFCRFMAASRVFAEATADARADLAKADDSRKLYALHFWTTNEQHTRYRQEALQQLLPHFAGCFRREAAALQPAAQLQQQQQQQQQQQADAQQQQNHPPPAEKLQVLNAAALCGGWWQPTAECDGGAAQALALTALAQCFGQGTADCIEAIVSDERCPAAARGFWGCMVLGLFLSLCVEVPHKSQARLVNNLLHIGQPGSLFPDSSRIPVICPLTAPDSTTEDPGRVECRWQQAALPHYVRYHARQFVCAVLVLVRAMVKRPTVGHMEDTAALKQLDFDLQTVLMKLHNDEEDAAIAAAQSQPGEPVWCLQSPEILPAAGLSANTVLTSEQFRILNHALPDNPREAQLIITVNALAGSGKSSVLRLLQLAHPDKTILYTAYNKAVIEDMKASMAEAVTHLGWRRRAGNNLPLNVDHLTTHGIASEAHQAYSRVQGWRIAGVRGSDLVPHLNVLDFFRQRQQERQHGGASYGMGYLVKDTLHCFCTSADEEVKATHVPVRRRNANTQRYDGLTAEEAVLATQQLWEAFLARRFTQFTVDFNWYLKAFVQDMVRTGRQLTASNGKPYDIILVDEAQDVNHVTYQLLLSQKCTIMFVGDRRQHIYAFNFAMDALRAAADEPHRRKKAFTLSHSFRLGPAVAEVANMVLHDLGEHKQTMIAAGRPHAAVYIMDPQEPPELEVPAADDEGDDAGDDDDGGEDAGAAIAAAIAAAVGAGAARAAAADAAAAAAAAAGVAPAPHPAAAAAAAAVAAEASAHAYQARLQEEGRAPYRQVQLLGEPVRPTAETPEQLQAVRIPILRMERRLVPLLGGQLVPDPDLPPRLVEGAPLFLAVPPRMPSAAGGRRFPLMFLSRTNLVWFQVAAALAMDGPPGRGIRALLGRPPRLYLMAGKLGAANQGEDAQGLANVEFFDKVESVYRFRYLDAAQDLRNPLRERQRYTDYISMREDVLGKAEDVDLKAPIIICEIYGPYTVAVLGAIRAVAVTHRGAADFMLGTCHKGKGQEELYAQLADDFAELSAHTRLVHEPKDELNLVYVALTRAMLGLVCNQNVARLLTAGTTQKYMEVQVGPAASEEEEEQDEEQQQRLVACCWCHFQFDPAAALAGRVGRLAVEARRLQEDGGAARMMWCNACVRSTLLGQLVVEPEAGPEGQQPQQ